MEPLRTSLNQRAYSSIPHLKVVENEGKNNINLEIDFYEILDMVEQIIQPKYLNNVQILVLQYVWQGLTYSEISQAVDYDFGYVKDTGSRLWKMLSESLDRKVSKQNVQIVLANHFQHFKKNSLINRSHLYSI
jgi:hypothetical protein